MMSKTLQRILLALGAGALLILLIEIGLAIAATQHGSTPARVVRVNAGPYLLTVSLYKDPADAGFALPFAIATQQPARLDVTSIPGNGVDATPVHSNITSDGNAPNGVQGVAEITVRGPWRLHIVVTGAAGRAEADVPITATAPPAIPQWLGWAIGFVPLYGLLVLLLLQRRGRQSRPEIDRQADSQG